MLSDSQCKKLPNGIYYFKFLKSSRRAVDEWLAEIDTIYEASPFNRTVLMMVDFRTSGAPPITYFMQYARERIASNPVHCNTRIAAILPENLMLPIVKMLFKTQRLDRTDFRIFAQPEAAEMWLLKTDH
jgi:hypothetical protein